MPSRKRNGRDAPPAADAPAVGTQPRPAGARGSRTSDVLARRLEVVGRLVSGVAHDFNNLLTVLAGNADLLLESGSLDASAREQIEEIRAVGVRFASLTQRLVTMASQHGGDVTRFDVREVLYTLQPLLRRATPPSITIDFGRSPVPLPVEGDRGLLELGLMTLAIGIRDAMPAGGSVTFRLSERRVTDEGVPGCQDIDPGDYVIVEVTDGVATLDEAARCIDLGVVERAVKLSRGWLHVARRDGSGTVTLFLPAADAAGAPG